MSSWTDGKARRWLWPRRTASVAMVAFGHGCGKRGGEPGKRGGRTEGVEASPGAGTGRRLSLQREAGGGACVRGRFLTATVAALGRGEEDDRGERLVGWAAQELGRLGYQVSAR